MLIVTSRLIKQSKQGDSFEFSSVQANLPQSIASEIIDWGKHNIANQYVYTEDGARSFGRENDIHVTVKFGLHTGDVDDVRKIVQDFGSFDVTLNDISRFAPPKNDFEVVKLEVDSDSLHELHRMIGVLDNSDEHPSYKPHITVAYIKPGACNDLSGCGDFTGRKVSINRLTFSSKSGSRSYITL